VTGRIGPPPQCASSRSTSLRIAGKTFGWRGRAAASTCNCGVAGASPMVATSNQLDFWMHWLGSLMLAGIAPVIESKELVAN
jgi:hypothetical protein